ncbi:DUF1566 domain-containing protein [Puniceicoccales bacterium CK1056]|uniref:DUF1566 domain-containing protein n=2 Tax=Oceanipulchritudo coccoides TaxID=2706888 RepID=A0A6B2LZS8_9BACT|nr:DUF1566 domain-containing protein [Oceanipulchritudo coccoides]
MINLNTSRLDYFGESHPSATLKYPIVDTAQVNCYNNTGFAISPPEKGEPLYGQDAQYDTTQPRYRDNGDGTVSDLITGLMWQQDYVEQKLTFAEASSGASSFALAGYDDWRLPTIKELWSIFQYSGVTGFSAEGSIPYIDTEFFNFAYGDTSSGERFIDAQYVSSTEYVGTTMNNNATVFGVNFADGRIKGYPSTRKLFDVKYVRGNTDYGINNFQDNADGTITDQATGLMWTKIDSGHLQAGQFGDGTLNWEQALEWAEDLEYAGYDDWRLPNGKELQSIVDYTRAPEASDPSRRRAAIDPIFQISNEQAYFWTNNSHVDGPNAKKAAYVCFGQSLGYMQDSFGNYQLIDVHGAGAIRSDPKTGDPDDYPTGFGPQGDDIRIYNYVRAVRGGLID